MMAGTSSLDRPGDGRIPDCLRDADVVRLSKGAVVFQAGDACTRFFYLLDGSVRVDLVSRAGKSILLYRFGADQTCVLTTSCLMSGEDYCAEAHVEEDAIVCVIPYPVFEAKLNSSPEFRRLVFSSLSQRLAAMMGKIEDVAFVSIDMRLAARVLELSEGADLIHATHEQLAVDLGTSREVVSRKLAQWEDGGLVARGRGSLRILKPQELRRRAAGES